MSETREQLELELRDIAKWEADQKSLWSWEKLSRLPFALLDRWTPRYIQDKIALALNELGKFIQSGGDYLVSEKAILDKLWREAQQAEQFEALTGAVWDTSAGGYTPTGAAHLPLAAMDAVASQLEKSRVSVATVQGAAGGFGGVLTLAVDIPAMLGLSLKLLQELAICYGFDPKDPKERVFIVKCLQFASSDIVGKKAILEELAHLDDEGGKVQVMSQLQGWREVIAAYRDSFGLKKLLQLVPIAGMLFGAYTNRESLKQVAETGRMLYRKRRIVARLRQEEA